MSPIDILNQYKEAKRLKTILHLPTWSDNDLMELDQSNRVKEGYQPFSDPTVTQNPIIEESKVSYESPSLIVSDRLPTSKKLGIALVLFAIGGLFAAAMPFFGLEYRYLYAMVKDNLMSSSSFIRRSLGVGGQPTTYHLQPTTTATPSPFLDHNPLIAPDGTLITPINSYFSLVIPKIGVNAPVVPGVNPVEKKAYSEALKKGVAHANTSYYPNENGTVYLFSHSTNYEWFVKDLNAVFYLLKKLEAGDEVVVMYLGNRYTYKIREKKIVGNREVSYLIPASGKRTLILQTCWPPGTAYKRQLIFADLVEVREFGSFEDILL